MVKDKTENIYKNICSNRSWNGQVQEDYTELETPIYTTKRKSSARDIETESIPETHRTVQIKKKKMERGDIYASDWAPRNSEAYFNKEHGPEC
ncbi:16949_t:CDS:2 [Gigaspora margarita]|uniref:16949_t:CDS:1 n=1 Tax=Gigaspora margarita TaxID=4874 RepID=A0ABM8W3J9_GIGMA|nr:16949_t:CDS:2 [Gigaspora margarita]